MTRPSRDPFEIRGQSVARGKTQSVEIPVARQPGEASPQTLSCAVIHGAFKGPTLFVSAAIHGDEINGTAIIRRMIDEIDPKTLKGTVLLVPVVNLFGFILHSRYLPDRRDLNRCFPGSARGSLGSRLARVFMDEIVSRSDVGLDLHTGSNHRTNAPQIRANLDDPRALELAKIFGAGIALHAKLRPGSLRESAGKVGVPTLTYEAGEAHRFDKESIEVGMRGVQRVLTHLGGDEPESIETRIVRSSKWLRARRSGMFWPIAKPGAQVKKGAILGRLTDILGAFDVKVKAPNDGVVLGLNMHPPVHQGDALVNLGFSLDQTQAQAE